MRRLVARRHSCRSVGISTAVHLDSRRRELLGRRRRTPGGGVTRRGLAMKKYLVALGIVSALSIGLAAPALADSTGHTGPPSQSCQDYSASTRPGSSGSSPGSPFNEPGINSANGGVGGANYSENSQY